MSLGNTQLDHAKRRKLAALISEFKSRGLEIPPELLAGARRQFVWPTSERGYFRRMDGAEYDPSQTQEAFVLSNAVLAAFMAGRGSGKALDINTEIPTPRGFKLLKDIRVGDFVFSNSGNPVRVTYVSPIRYGHECYDVVFDDDSHIVADSEHLWWVLSAKARKSFRRRGTRQINGRNAYKHQNQPKYSYDVVTTEHIYNNLFCNDRNEINFSVDLSEPINSSPFFTPPELIVNPYILGYWLGDGTSAGSRFTIGDSDIDDVSSIFSSLGFELRAEKTKLSYSIDKYYKTKRNMITGRFEKSTDTLYAHLRELNLLNNKHIPEKYLFSSYAQRLDLLCGLMDSDGYIDADGKAEFCTTNEKLAQDFYVLCYSLGIKTSQKKNMTQYKGNLYIKYRFTFVPYIPVFRLKRKLKNVKERGNQSVRRYRRFIVDVKPCDSVPVLCIKVNSDDGLFLVGKGFIPTHNTAAGAQKACRKIMQGESGAVYNPDFENLKTSTWPELRQWIPWELVIPKHHYRKEESFQPLQPFKLYFKNGAFMLIKGLKDPDSARGPNINWLWYDEPARDLLGLSWMIALAAVRIGKNPQAWITGTPGGKDHWIYKFFVEKDIPQDALDAFNRLKQDRNLIDDVYFGSIYDNERHLNPVFMATMLATYRSGYLREQEIFGKFVNPGGTLGNPDWFKDKMLESPPEEVVSRVRYWDMAATEKKMIGNKELNSPDESVGTLLSFTKERKFVIEHQVSATVEWEGLLTLIRDTAIQDGPTVRIIIEQEPASGGKNQVAAVAKYLQEQLPGYPINPDKLGWRPDQDRVILANLWFGEASRGMFYMVKGAWNEPFFRQLGSFPDVQHDDKITSVTGARVAVAPLKLWRDIKFMAVGKKPEETKEEPEKQPIVGI